MSTKDSEWNDFIDKKVSDSEGKEVGKMKEKSDNYILIETGSVRKDSFWIPEYLFELADGKPKLDGDKGLRLSVKRADVRDKYEYSHKPTTNQYKSESELFQNQRKGTVTPGGTSDSGQKSTVTPGGTDDPIQILKLRLAKGEITPEQFNNMRKLIES